MTNFTKIRQAPASGEWCTTASMRALGFEPQADRVRTCPEVVVEMRRAGFKVEEIQLFRKSLRELPNLGRFLSENADGGSYLIFTSGHAMALVNDTLTDTAFGGPRRRVLAAYRVEV